jgi:hypothetical protein
MSNPMVRIHNAETNEVIDREMTNDEFKAYQAQQAIDAAEKQKLIDAAEAKTALLAKLGITAEEAALLLG